MTDSFTCRLSTNGAYQPSTLQRKTYFMPETSSHCKGHPSRRITSRDLVKLANVISFNDIGASMGNGILLPLLDIFNRVKNSRKPPKQWNSVIITVIYKNNGSRKSLINYRGIFLASIIAKVFERLLKDRIKTQLEKIDLCQAGSRSNRGPPDNTFIVNAVIDHSIYIGKSLYVTIYDFEQAFDSLWLQDCILSLRQLGISDSILQLIYNLNKEAQITVKTPFGRTSTALVEDVVQQGRVLAPDLCSASTAEYCGRNRGWQ